MIEVRRTGRKVTGIKLRRGPGYGGAGYRTLHEERSRVGKKGRVRPRPSLPAELEGHDRPD